MLPSRQAFIYPAFMLLRIRAPRPPPRPQPPPPSPSPSPPPPQRPAPSRRHRMLCSASAHPRRTAPLTCSTPAGIALYAELNSSQERRSLLTRSLLAHLEAEQTADEYMSPTLNTPTRRREYRERSLGEIAYCSAVVRLLETGLSVAANLGEAVPVFEADPEGVSMPLLLAHQVPYTISFLHENAERLLGSTLSAAAHAPVLLSVRHLRQVYMLMAAQGYVVRTVAVRLELERLLLDPVQPPPTPASFQAFYVTCDRNDVVPGPCLAVVEEHVASLFGPELRSRDVVKLSAGTAQRLVAEAIALGSGLADSVYFCRSSFPAIRI